MSNLKLIELLDSEFNSNIKIVGLDDFLFSKNCDSFKGNEVLSNAENLKVSYYCFNIPFEMLERYSSNKKFSAMDLINSSVFQDFNEKLFDRLNMLYDKKFLNYSDFQNKEEIIQNILNKYVSDKMSLDDVNKINDGKIKEMNAELKDVPFYSQFFRVYKIHQSRFLFSDFQIKYSSEVKEYIDLFKREFENKDFDLKKINDFLFERYGLFKK